MRHKSCRFGSATPVPSDLSSEVVGLAPQRQSLRTFSKGGKGGKGG